MHRAERALALGVHGFCLRNAFKGSEMFPTDVTFYPIRLLFRRKNMAIDNKAPLRLSKIGISPTSILANISVLWPDSLPRILLSTRQHSYNLWKPVKFLSLNRNQWLWRAVINQDYLFPSYMGISSINCLTGKFRSRMLVSFEFVNLKHISLITIEPLHMLESSTKMFVVVLAQRFKLLSI